MFITAITRLQNFHLSYFIRLADFAQAVQPVHDMGTAYARSG
jgi:hypothetical protein